MNVGQRIKVHILNNEYSHDGRHKGDILPATVVSLSWRGDVQDFMFDRDSEDARRYFYIDDFYFSLAVEDDLEPAMS